jgi:hypothetical protein
MPIRFSYGNRLLRTAVLLGFLACLVAKQTGSSESATNEPPIVTIAAGMSVCWAMPNVGGSRFANPDHAYFAPLSGVFAGSACKVHSFRFNGSDSMLTGLVEISARDECEVAVEDQDSIEVFRIDIQQRAFGIDQAVTGPEITSKVARKTRPNISPPLLV